MVELKSLLLVPARLASIGMAHTCGHLSMGAGLGCLPWGGGDGGGAGVHLPALLLPVHPHTYTDAGTIPVIIPTMVTVTVAEMPAS